jgi:tRNA-N(6)-(isopentenyl)adenosine-37 thiotransferase enzyme MiaB
MNKKEKIEFNKNQIDIQNKYMKNVYEINKKEILKYTIITMGCQLNENDSEKICGMAEDMGYSYTESIVESNLIILNTCCIRENAEAKVFGKLGEAKVIKQKNDAIICIGGCMPGEAHTVEKIKTSYPFVDIIFDTHTLYKFPELLHEVLLYKKKVRDVLDIDGEVYEGLPIKRNDNFKANVTIMYGCNNFCTYCIVPYVRGRERSRQLENIVDEVNQLSKEGYKEITLLGQNVNSYGKDLEDGTNFAILLNELDKIEGIEIIKFVSPHPKDFTDDVIKAIKNSKKVSRLIHLPLQSGSTSTLKLMNRKYTKEHYLELVDKIKQEIPEISISTDIIVGFPEETEEDFKDTLDVVEKVKFEQVFMFIYSVRKGTVAEKMNNHVTKEVQHERFNRLKNLVENQIEENNQKYIGTIQQIMVEGKSKNNDYMLTGRTSTNKVVNFEGNHDLIGKMIDVKIISQHMWYLKGEVIEKANRL